MKKIIALDIGGTNTRVALINEKYEIEKVLIKDTVVGNRDNFLASVSAIVEEAIPDRTGVIGMACGVPGRVRHDGYIDVLPNVGISEIPLAKYLSAQFGIPAFVKNDAEVAALAEANVGPNASYKSLYFVTVSTGVGGALTMNGRLVNSSYEIGHTVIPYKGEYYEFEHLCSGTGLRKLCALNGLEVANSREFFELFLAKDEKAVAIYNDWLNLFKFWIRMVQDAFSPEVFAFTGGVMKSKDIFFEDLRARVPFAHLEECGCGQYAGLIGAAVFGFQNCK